MSLAEATSGRHAAQTLVHCSSCSTIKPMGIKQLVFRVACDKVIYQCVECGAEIEFASKMNSTKELKTRLRD